jgi:hypothetical protein
VPSVWLVPAGDQADQRLGDHDDRGDDNGEEHGDDGAAEGDGGSHHPHMVAPTAARGVNPPSVAGTDKLTPCLRANDGRGC